MLTRKQYELLLFINDRLGEGGVSPSFDEMKDALGLKSKSGIHRLITGLEERGFIRRLPHRARALEVLRLPDGAETGSGRQQRGSDRSKFQPNVIKGDFTGALAGREVNHEVEAIELPLYGRIAAGTPIEALRDNSAMINVPSTMLPPGDHYALEVAGDSMVEAGILDGDTVIINRCDMADSGSIVVALIDEHEVTLKRLRRKGQTVALEPANSAFETRIFGADRVRVQGRLVGLLRRY
jgi:repressor LexA